MLHITCMCVYICVQIHRGSVCVCVLGWFVCVCVGGLGVGQNLVIISSCPTGKERLHLIPLCVFQPSTCT